MVSGGDDIDTAGEYLVGDLGSNTESVRRVLPVDYDQIGGGVPGQLFQMNKKRPDPRLTYNVADDQSV
jgi:hypothetical protein